MKILAVILISILLVVGLVGCEYGGTAISTSWTISGQSVNSELDSLRIVASEVDGNATRRLYLTYAELDSIHIISSNTVGDVLFRLTQDNIEHVYDISGYFSGTLSTDAFQAGRIRLRVDFGGAENVDFFVSWGE